MALTVQTFHERPVTLRTPAPCLFVLTGVLVSPHVRSLPQRQLILGT